MAEWPLVELTAVACLAAITAYVLFAGADFGGGVWDLFATGPRARRQRALIADTIGPIWEANHVWLILVVVILFTGFPVAYARLSVSLHIPLTLMLIGVVLRGSAFTFRSYDRRDDDVQRRWGLVFARIHASNVCFCAPVIGNESVGFHMPRTIPEPTNIGKLLLRRYTSRSCESAIAAETLMNNAG